MDESPAVVSAAAFPLGHVWIVGAGRLGLALALRLRDSGAVDAITVSGRAASPREHPVFASPPIPIAYLAGLGAAPPHPSAVLIAVPDRAVGQVAGRLAALGIAPSVPILHTSGSLSLDVLAPLGDAGHPVGSVHPLAAVADGGDGAERLRGVAWGIEGQGAAAEAAERVVRACEGRALRISPGHKAEYHAAAVFAANYGVALLSIAERLMGQAGVMEQDARASLAALAEGAVRNVAAHGPAAALTGPIARGDAETVERHLARLSPDLRAIYCLLGREALRLARGAGLDPAAAHRLAALLEDTE
ncbi:MAG TPA: DUF2520 domain-containing protein [Longimicrobium sp.]|nr:DUF2520 domain-containing protein [Longimicrobium sp.]